MDLSVWKERVSSRKNRWINLSENGDLPPTIFVERDGEEICIIESSIVDRDMGLLGAKMSKIFLQPDAITILIDARIKDSSESMPRECLVLQRIDKDKNLEFGIFPYNFQGGKIEWFDFPYSKTGNVNAIDGHVTQTLRDIMDRDDSLLYDKLNKVADMLEINSGHTRQTQRFHTDRVAFRFLADNGFVVIADKKYSDFDEECSDEE